MLLLGFSIIIKPVVGSTITLGSQTKSDAEEWLEALKIATSLKSIFVIFFLSGVFFYFFHLEDSLFLRALIWEAHLRFFNSIDLLVGS